MELWAWGNGGMGQLATGNFCDFFKPTKLQLQFQLHCDSIVVLGGGHTFLISKTEGVLYASGWNHKGQCGLKTSKQNLAQFTKVKTPEKFVQVAAGWDFSVGIDQHGKAYGCGSNLYGQIGLSPEIKFQEEFKQIESVSGIKAVSCGMRHTIFLCENGRVFACGNGKKGQLCTRTPLKDNVFNVIEVLTSNCDGGDSNSIGGKRVTAVKAGQNFSLLEYEDGSIEAFGDDKHNQVSHISALVEGQSPSSQIEVGWTHVVCLYENGSVKSVGRSDYGQTNVSSLSSIQRLSIGYEHGLAINTSKELYSWGWNEHGNCGLGNTENVLQPIKVDDFEGQQNVMNCFAGSGHSFALVKKHSSVTAANIIQE